MMIQARTLADLSEVPEVERDFYVPAADGTFRLHPELADLCDTCEADLAAQEARVQRMQATLEDLLIKREIRAALQAAGIQPQFVPAVTAHLRERMRFHVDDAGADDPAVSVADAYGEVGVGFAVRTWLATEEADPYRPAPKPGDGALTARLRQLRAAMQ